MPVELAFQVIAGEAVRSDTPALLVLHGLFGSANNWRSIAKRLSLHHRVFTLDARNHGASPHTTGMDYRLMALDVVRFLDDHGLDEAIMIGHSMGGKTAMRLALEAPGRVARLIVVDIAPVAYGHRFDPLLDAMQSLDLPRVGRRAEVDNALAGAITDRTLRAFLLQNLVHGSTGYRWRINLQAIRENQPALLDIPCPAPARPYAKPALFIRGESSSTVSPMHYDQVYRLFPAAEIVGIEGAGHWVHADRPVEFVACVTRFLGD